MWVKDRLSLIGSPGSPESLLAGHHALPLLVGDTLPRKSYEASLISVFRLAL